MEDIKEILNKLIQLYNEDIPNDLKHSMGEKLWTRYYEICNTKNIQSDEGYNLSLMLESESYIINQKPIRKEIDNDKLIKSINHLKEVNYNNSLGLEDGITMEEAITILDWTVENTRENIQKLGIDIDNNSLNGFCEIAQKSSILPLEELGLTVTKNQAKSSFDYPFNHCFGTVTFKILENNLVKDIPFLIDVTYRQFFSTVRCNYGRYYTKEENTLLDTAPDPGYFVKDVDFARNLLGNGYIILNDDTAKKYGESFYLASLLKDEPRKDDNKNYYNDILNSSSDYKISDFDFVGFNTSIPSEEKLTNRYTR